MAFDLLGQEVRILPEPAMLGAAWFSGIQDLHGSDVLGASAKIS